MARGSMSLLACALALGGLVGPGCDGGECQPKTEVCDQRDNDCNGLVDDGLQRLCETACGVGVEVCEQGQWVGCDARQPELESCNGLDDDCNGLFDEDATTSQLLTRPCSTECGQGVETCRLGVWRDCDAAAPVEELCNDLDDDCDGETDEELDHDLDQDGHHSLDSCASPHDDCRDNLASVHPGHAEDCDAQDNDCDGQIDEGCACTPTTTQACGAELGVCRLGTQTCDGVGAWGACLDAQGAPVILPGGQAEACNLQDDDCDGETDEGNPGAGAVCGTEEGECRQGTLGCQDGELRCRGLYVGEADEALTGCDGLDNDCDGLTDEGLPQDEHEANEDCQHPGVLADLLEWDAVDQFTLVVEDLSLYHADATPDTDWYRGDALEASHLDPGCVGNPLPPQYFDFRISLGLPPLATPEDWELCVVPFECGSADVFCTQAADWSATAWQYTLALVLEGRCFFDDSFRYFLVVRSRDPLDPVADCRGYRLEATMVYCGTSGCS